MLINRARYPPKDWAEDEERRDAAGVPDEIMFATKPRQTAAVVANALQSGIDADWLAGDEICSRRELRTSIWMFGLGCAVGVSHTHVVTGAGRRGWTARQVINKVLPHQWVRMLAGHGTKDTREYNCLARLPADDNRTEVTTTAPVSWSPASTDTPAGSPSSAAGRPAASP